jgi:hypothetical protein
VREVEFRAYLSQEQFKQLRRSKPSAGLVAGALAITLAWIFSAISLGPATLEFGSRPVGSGSILPVKLTNRGMTDFHATSIAVVGDSEDFHANAQPCATVASGDSCVVWVEFRPRKPGVKLARLVVRTQDGSELRSDFTGRAEEGIADLPQPLPQPRPALEPPPSDQLPHRPAPPAPLPAPSPSEPTDQPGRIATPEPELPPQTPPSEPTPPPIATPPPAIVPPYFPPPHVAPEVPQIQIAPRVMDFSGRAGRRQQLIISNPGSRSLGLRFDLLGNDRDSFEYDANACGNGLAAHRQCFVIVSYRGGIDSQERPLTAWLNVRHNARNAANPETVALRWEQVGPPRKPHVSVSPGTIRFNSPSPASEFFSPLTQTVQVRSDGTAGLRQLNLRLDFGGGPFRYSTNCPTTLEPGQGCAAQVNLAARDGRAYAGRLGVFEGAQLLAIVALQAIGSQPPPPTDTGGNGLHGGAQLPPRETAIDPTRNSTPDGSPNWPRAGGSVRGVPSRAHPPSAGRAVPRRTSPNLDSSRGTPLGPNSPEQGNVRTDITRRSVSPRLDSAATAGPRQRSPRPPPAPPPEQPR